MNKQLLQIPSSITSFQTLSDKGIKLIIHTQELNSEDGLKLLEMKGKIGYFLFKETRISEEEAINIPSETKEFKTDKTASQRLRAVIYVIWENTSKKETFEEFYKRHIEKIINQYKDQLNKEE